MTYSTCSHQNETFQDSVVLWWIETDKKKKEKKNNWCDSEFDRLISKSSFTCSKLSQLEQILISTWSAYEVNVPKRLHYTMQQAALIQIWVEDYGQNNTDPHPRKARRKQICVNWSCPTCHYATVHMLEKYRFTKEMFLKKRSKSGDCGRFQNELEDYKYTQQFLNSHCYPLFVIETYILNVLLF